MPGRKPARKGGTAGVKRLFIIIVLIGVYMASISPVYANRYPVYHHHHYPYWSSFGIGIITGAIVANLFYRPPDRTIIVEPAYPVGAYPVGAYPIVAQPAPIVKRSSSPVYKTATSGHWVAVATQRLNVRSGPGMDFPVIGRVYQGDLLLTRGSAPAWIYVRLPDGNFGWVMSEYISPTAFPAKG
jgi:hypothetical protein